MSVLLLHFSSVIILDIKMYCEMNIDFFFLPQRLIWDAKKLGDLFMSQVKSVVHLGIQLWILKFHIADWQNASKVPYSWQSQLCVNTRRWNVEGAKVATQMTLYLLKLFKKNHKIIQIFLQASRQQSNWSRGKKIVKDSLLGNVIGSRVDYLLSYSEML